ncbi:hypothetical protein NXY42_01660 [Bacteroides fragilis]|nr:hypothetical protein [Bacteroides fragilis]
MKKIEKKGVFSGKRDKCWSERDSCDGSGRSLLLKTKGQITKYYPINKPINNLLNGYSQFETASNGNYI